MNTVGKTSATQVSDTLVDASNLNTSDMGSMGGMGGKGTMSFPGGDMQKPQNNSGSTEEVTSEKPKADSDETNNKGNSNSRPQIPENFQGGKTSDSGSSGNMQQNGQMQKPDGSSRPDSGQSQFSPQSTISASGIIMLGVSVAALGLGIVFALRFKRRR